MSDKKDSKKFNASLFKELSFGTFLRLWLFFLFSFFFLGYPIPLSIILGFAGGLAGGWIMGWWKSSEGPREVEPEPEQEPIEEKPRVSGLRKAKQQRDTRLRRRSSGSLIPFGNFLRR